MPDFSLLPDLLVFFRIRIEGEDSDGDSGGRLSSAEVREKGSTTLKQGARKKIPEKAAKQQRNGVEMTSKVKYTGLPSKKHLHHDLQDYRTKTNRLKMNMSNPYLCRKIVLCSNLFLSYTTVFWRSNTVYLYATGEDQLLSVSNFCLRLAVKKNTPLFKFDRHTENVAHNVDINNYTYLSTLINIIRSTPSDKGPTARVVTSEHNSGLFYCTDGVITILALATTAKNVCMLVKRLVSLLRYALISGRGGDIIASSKDILSVTFAILCLSRDEHINGHSLNHVL
uniref:Fuz_longin_2 domain-containing protein n=1 Tax=Steinernema glaseri TaxID=37863 RepID=A0A1I8AQ01_9BILA